MYRVLMVLGLAGCVSSSSVACDDGRICPIGSLCTALGCASQAQLDACGGKADGDACTIDHLDGMGTCIGGACISTLCGNATLDPGEACDDGNHISGDNCRGDCGKIEICGDGILDAGEACDDGNTNPGDTCSGCRIAHWDAAPFVGEPLRATDLTFDRPSGLAYDTAGRLYVSDALGHRIVRIEADGTTTAIAGTYRQPGYEPDPTTAVISHLSQPRAVAVDGIGRVFVADSYNATIRRLDLDGRIATIVGAPSPGSSGDDGPATQARLDLPVGVAVDPGGVIAVADLNNHKIRMIDTNGTITTVAGTGQPGLGPDGAGPVTALDSPSAVAFDARGRIVFADTGNHLVRRVDPITSQVVTLPGAFTKPIGLAIEPSGAILVVDELTPTSGVVRRIDVGGAVSTLSEPFIHPLAVAVDAQGHVAVADGGALQVVEIQPDRSLAVVAGSGATEIDDDGVAATSVGLNRPVSTAIDAMGRVLVVVTADNRVRRIELDGSIHTLDLGALVLTAPEAVAVDRVSGAVAIADSGGHRVIAIAANGTSAIVAGTGAIGSPAFGIAATLDKLRRPAGLAFHPTTGELYIADVDDHRVVRIGADGQLHLVAGNGTAAFGGDGTAASVLHSPRGLAFDNGGALVIADSANQRIRRVDVATRIIATIAGASTIAGFNGDGLAATATQLASPSAVALDASGRIVFADTDNTRVRRFVVGGTVETLVGTGGEGEFAGDGLSATAATVDVVLGIAVDGSDRIVLTDSSHKGALGYLRRIESGATPRILTIAGAIDPKQFGAVGLARLATPYQLALDGAGGLFVAGGMSRTVDRIAGGFVAAVTGRYPSDAVGLARFDSRYAEVRGVAVDLANHAMFVATGDTVDRVDTTAVDPSRWTHATIAGSRTASGFTDGAGAAARFRTAAGLDYDAAAHALWIVDTGNHAVRTLDVQTLTVATAVNTAHALGFAGDGGPASAALLYAPSAIVRCDNGDRFIADTGNHRVRRIEAVTGTISTVLGDGTAASSGEGAPSRNFLVDTPRGLACDALGNVFVTSRTTVRQLVADEHHVVDGSGAVATIFGAPPRDRFPATAMTCLAAVVVTAPGVVAVADACTGLAVTLTQHVDP